jgi:RNA polymerase sigma factor (sigma-70 family)
VDSGDAEIYRKHIDELARFAAGLVGPTDAPDVASEAFLSCMNSAKWQGVTEKRSYLYRSVYNKAAEFHRSSRRRQMREQTGAQRERTDPPEVRPEVLAAIFTLSVRQRAVIVLTYWDDLSPEAIANLLGISDGAVRRHLARAKSRLKEILNAAR